jgi:ferredoxin-NADP reductase
MELTLDLSTVAIAEHAHDGHLNFDQLGRLVFDWEDRPTWACGLTAMLDAVEKVWDDAGLRDGLHMERFTIARTDKGGEGGTVTFSISDKRVEIDGATSLLEAGERSASDAVRLPDGHLPDVRSAGGIRAHPRLPIRR